MSAEACEFCNGSHYLMDYREMGPCVCVTAEALRAAEEALTTALDYHDAAGDLLRDYLVSIGLPADPLSCDNPHLWALVDAVIYQSP